MTSAQYRKYLREWGPVRRTFRAQGLSSAACDAKRHELHRKALGFDKSSLALSNSEFDAVLAVFSAISRPADLETQLRLQEQTDRRAAMTEDLIEFLRSTSFVREDNTGLQIYNGMHRTVNLQQARHYWGRIGEGRFRIFA